MDIIQAEDLMEHLIDKANEWWNELESEEAVNIYLKTSYSKTSTEKKEFHSNMKEKDWKYPDNWDSQKEHFTKSEEKRG